MTEKGALAILTGQVRRSLSLVAARATDRCLLDRVEVLGSGDKAALGRRRWREQEVRALEMEQSTRPKHAAWKGCAQKGEFYLM